MPEENNKQEITLPALAICSFCLWAKMFITLTLQGMRSQRPPEDKKNDGDNNIDDQIPLPSQDNLEAGMHNISPLNMFKPQFTLSERWDRIVRNDLENIPMALILAWGSYITDTETFGDAYDLTITGLMISFTIFRYLHTFFYAKQLQPWRSIVYGLSQLCQAGFGILLMIEGFHAIVDTKSNGGNGNGNGGGGGK